MRYCLPYLKAQIEIVQPRVVVALGMTAVNGLLGFDPARRMGKIRGKWQSYGGADLMITYHPSFLLQYASAQMKRYVWEDMMAVMERVGIPISEKQRGYFLPK
ncbi:MAG: uracil-DNA glycosylase, partial [Opitutales bacterium]|nr:uracil-DNA glycosylase [Opitutales bacterium]